MNKSADCGWCHMNRQDRCGHDPCIEVWRDHTPAGHTIICSCGWISAPCETLVAAGHQWIIHEPVVS